MEEEEDEFEAEMKKEMEERMLQAEKVYWLIIMNRWEIVKTVKSYFPPNWLILVLLKLLSICYCKLVLNTDTCILAIHFLYLYNSIVLESKSFVKNGPGLFTLHIPHFCVHLVFGV